MSAESQHYDFDSILDAAEPASESDLRVRRAEPRQSSRTQSVVHTRPAVVSTQPKASAGPQDRPDRSDDYCARVTAHLDACGFSRVRISMDKGLLAISGVVASQYEKALAIDYVRRFARVSAVSDQLRVDSQQRPERALERVVGFGCGIGQTCIDSFSATPRFARYVIAACLVVVIASWWRPAAGDRHIPVYPVSGKLLVDGEVPTGAQIVLHPQGHTLPEGIAATATVKEDGSFSVSIYGTEPGVPPGEYVATVHWFQHLGSESQGKRGPADLFVSMHSDRVRSEPAVPPIYSSPSSSPLRLTVREDLNEITPIVISRR